MSKCVKLSLFSLVLLTFFACSNDLLSYVAGDLDGNNSVNIKDLRIMAWEWLDPECLISGCQAELDDIDGVSMGDFAILANNWAETELHLLISEFLASNSSQEPLENGEMLDGDGQSSDWIEIYNPTDATISLDGWYLTDNKSDPTMWQFPDGLSIDPGEFLIVFASEKTEELYPDNYPYLDPDGYYHTNFNLNQAGDYLALVSPDGQAIIHDYDQYPTQLTNVSYGLMQHASKLIAKGAVASYHVPTAGDSGQDWSDPSFDDSSWDTGPTGIGFGIVGVSDENLVARYEFEGNCDDISGNGHDGTLFGDITFETDPVRGEVLSLPGGSNQYVYIGEVGINANMPTTIACWAKADHTLIPDWTLVFGFTTPGGDCGSHFNVGSLGGPGGVGAHAWCWEETIFTDEQALEWRHYAMTYDGTTIQYYGDGVWMDTDPGKSNVVDLSIRGDNVHIGSRATQDSSFPGNVDDARIYNRVLNEEEIAMVMAGSAVATDVQDEMLNINASLWTRFEFEVEDPDFYDILTLRIKYEDGFVAYLNGEPVASRNAPSSVKWDSTALTNRPIEDSSVFESINIMAYMSLLRPKPEKNVLAIQVLNDSDNDGELLLMPELVIAKNLTVPQYFAIPTPGTFNTSGASGVVKEVWFSHERGFHNSQFLLTLSTATEGSEIRYTTDGSRPTITHGTIYVGPIVINKTSTIRAVAVKPGLLDSDVKTHTYIFVSDVVTQSLSGEAPGPDWPPPGTVYNAYGGTQEINYGMDPDVVLTDPRYSGVTDDALLAIPTVSLVTNLDNLFDPSIGIYVNASQEGLAWERPVSVELINPDGGDGFQIDAGMRIRGGYSAGGWNPKHAFRLFFRAIYGGQYGEGKLRFPLFGDEGVDEFDHVDLRCSQNYSWAHGGGGGSANTVVRDVFSRDMQGLMGHPYTKSRYYHLYINGVYWGLFQTQERSEATFGETYMGGDKEDYDVISSNYSAGRQMVPTDGNRESLDRFYYETIAGLDNHERYYRIQGLNIDGTRNPAYERLLDVENLIDFMVIEYYTGDSDGPGSRFGNIPNNTWCMYNRVNPDGYKWFHHDNEHSLGSGGASGSIENLVEPFTTAGAQIQYFNPHWLHEQLANTNVDYRIQFADHVYRHMFNDGLLTVEKAREHVQERADQMNMAIIGESARWGDASYHPVRTKHDDWLPEIDRLLYSSSDPWGRQTYITPRIPVVIGQYRDVGWYPNIDPPTFNEHGGAFESEFDVSMVNPNPSGIIYYTTDGTDPRVTSALSGPGIPIPLVSENAFKRYLVPTGSLSGSVGSILWEYWLGISGNYVSDLTSSPDFPGNPSGTDILSSFETPTDWSDTYGSRVRGYLHPPENGSYTFWTSSDDNSQLWLSTNDDPANANLIASENSWSDPRVWQTGDEQSDPITLVGGQKYYIEALMKEGSGGDNLAVTWQGPGIDAGSAYPYPIGGSYLSPAGDTWATNFYDDTGWPSGTGGVGYETDPGSSPNYLGLFNINVEADMYGENGTCYIRIPFSVSNTDLSNLTLRMRYDDGFVAYINGVEVERRNFTGTPQWDSNASDQNEDANAINFQDFDISDHINALQYGENVLAIQGLNISTTSTDFLISAELIGTQVNQGDVRPGADQYTGDVHLDKSTTVKARVYDNGLWSALHEAVFAIGPVKDDLRITEIMYHPKNTGSVNDPNTEYIELKNIGLEPLNLNLVKFTEGIGFTFPDMILGPGEYVVVVKSISEFEAKYGTSVNTAGEYTGSLANNGERIKLVDAIGQTILDFKYKDGWYPIADGGGFSLTIIEPSDSAAYSSAQEPVAHWKFDDGAPSPIAVDSAGTNNGILYGDPTWTAGRIGGALSFDGDGDYVRAAAVDALAGDSLTVQAWVRLGESAGMWNPVIDQHDSESDGYYFYISNYKPAFYVINGLDFAQVASNDIMTADRWYHIAGTNDGSNLKLYVDGLHKTSTSSAGFMGVSDDVYIACEPVTPLYYSGMIDDVRIYDRALTDSDFQNIVDPMTRWSRKSSWRASVYRNGTPGWDDTGKLPNPGAVVINEVMSHSNTGTDWIELHNTTNGDINIGGWFLSDNDRDEPNLTKYRIADGTVIPKDSFIVFYEDANFANPGDPGYIVPFALSENGEKACLSSPLDPNGMLTGYRDIEDFGAAATNVSFGRYYKPSTGTFNFVAMDSNTPLQPNSDPKVGPIVINEIMYNPPTGNQLQEYIELYNITTAPVTLYRADKGSSWKFTDGIDYTFSSEPPITIFGNRYLLVVKEDPDDFIAAFALRYGYSLPPTVQVVGGYDGWLSNGGERLQIGLPGDIDEFGSRQYIRIDRVTYSDGSHPEDVPGSVDLWPEDADGNGKSLSRKESDAYGNDIANWEAADPSPGLPNP